MFNWSITDLLLLQVLMELTRQADQENTVLALAVSQLGAEGRMKTFDLAITAYLRKVGLDYCEIRGRPILRHVKLPRTELTPKGFSVLGTDLILT